MTSDIRDSDTTDCQVLWCKYKYKYLNWLVLEYNSSTSTEYCISTVCEVRQKALRVMCI